MKLAIMQPYFFPYIGYFQLAKAVDTFIIYDNIQFTKKGWINRNRILQNNEDSYITISLVKDSDYLDIKKREISPNFDKNRIISRIENSYRKSPYFKSVMPLVKDIISYEETNLFKYIQNSLVKVFEYLSIDTAIIISSTVDIDHTLAGEDKVIALTKAMKANHYINPIGGLELYSKDRFKAEGIDLNFIRTGDIKYDQQLDEFIPFLSIIDLMMFNSREEINKILDNYELC